MKKFRKLWLSSILVFSLVLSGCFGSSAKAPVYNTEHTNVKFEEMKYERPDTESLTVLIDETKELTKETGKKQEILDKFDQIINELGGVDAMYAIALIHTQIDAKDEFYSSEIEFLSNFYSKTDNKLNEVTKAILESDYASAFKKHMGDDFIARYEASSKLNSTEVEQFTQKEIALKQSYEKASVDRYTTIYNGQEVTLDDLDYSDPNIHIPYYEIMEKKNAVLGEIYRELVQVRVKIATTLGYESYAEYAYDSLGYDYDPEEARNLQTVVKQIVAPLYKEIETTYSESMKEAADSSSVTFEEGIPLLEKAIKAEFPDNMLEALTFMQDNNLYLFTSDEHAAKGAFTMFINKYLSEFMFINTGIYEDPSTVFHEFGHFYNFFHYLETKWKDLNDLNLAEVHSQGLEVLMFPYYEELYGENAQIMKYQTLFGMIGSVVQGCMEDEFQQKVFENPDMSLDEMNQLHGDISLEYLGYSTYYEWVDIRHHFNTPFYYISYATSAIAALELWTISEKDRSNAIDLYTELAKYTANAQLLETLDTVGLSDPFLEKSIKSIVSAIEKEMDLTKIITKE